MRATQALGIDGNPGHVPGLGLQRDYNIQLEPWARYDYTAIVGPPAQLPAGQTIQAAQYEQIYKLTFPADAQGNPRIGFLHARAVSGPGGARDLEWFVPNSVLTDGDPTQPPAVRRHMIDLRPKTTFDVVTGPVQVGSLVKHVDAVK